jgi:D-glycero-alpha-D-manno-heptose-7-phosphate kinase
MIEQTRKQGTMAAKVCGAGGGGCVVFMVRPGSKPAVEQALTRMGGQIINFGISSTGLEVHADQVERARELR